MSINKVILKGRLGGDPKTNNGVVKFSLATSESYTKKDNGEKVTETQWHNIVAFQKLGEIISKYVKKGDELVVIGKIQYKEHEGKRYTTIIAGEIDFISNGKSGSNSNQASNEMPVNNVDPDLPF